MSERKEAVRERFDVIYSSHGAHIDYHFCREWDGDGGCYGTNPEHGLSFDEACDEVADWYASQADQWRQREHHGCLEFRPLPHDKETEG